ncbi:MAG: hypothetical protein EXR02_00770 [Rhodospirillales bacterium]|nr:hypothetical protein [Rhodospirillales bacterium]MSP79589.1 hypothetical protein [Rhodospirillales bacterium]
MDISVNKTGQNTYVVALGEKRAVLNDKDMKKLLRQVVETLLPDVIKFAPRPEDLPIRLKHANIVSVQTFLRSVDHAELIVFLKATEKDAMLQKKIQAALDPAARKAITEDLAQLAKAEQPPAMVERAFKHLTIKFNELDASGVIAYES